MRNFFCGLLLSVICAAASGTVMTFAATGIIEDPGARDNMGILGGGSLYGKSFSILSWLEPNSTVLHFQATVGDRFFSTVIVHPEVSHPSDPPGATVMGYGWSDHSLDFHAYGYSAEGNWFELLTYTGFMTGEPTETDDGTTRTFRYELGPNDAQLTDLWMHDQNMQTLVGTSFMVAHISRVSMTISEVPEPATGSLVFLGIVLVGALRKRSR